MKKQQLRSVTGSQRTRSKNRRELSAMVCGFLLTLLYFSADAQTLTNNYVIAQGPRVSGITNDSTLSANNTNKTKVQVSIQYIDGLGRPVQTVLQQASPKGYDMVAPQAYDQYGREVFKYLPYSPETGTAGSFRPNAVSTDQNTFYTTPPTGSGFNAITDPYAQTAFDNSPLNRPVEQGAPGVAWQLTGVTGGGHTVKTVYTLNNDTSFTSDSVKGRQVSMYYTTINGDTSQALRANGYYPANILTVTITKDENWTQYRAGTMEEYKDIDGNVVLKREYCNNAGVVQQLSTYYIYDDFGRLAFVLPPASGADGAGTISQAKLNNLCYQYRYDERGRLSGKKIPGKGWEYIVYNIMDQPVATQDSLQRANNNWIFSKYDAQGRLVMSGIWNNGNTAIKRVNLQSILTGITSNLYEKSITTGNGYTNNAWPTSSVTAILNLNYYDNYANVPGLPITYSAPTGADMATRGELTATKTAVLNTPTDMLWTAHYYDYWGKSLTTYEQHYLGGALDNKNYDSVSTRYNFTNAPTTITRKHWNAASTTYPLVTIYNRYTYDWIGRKQSGWEQLTNGNSMPDTLRLVSNLSYNEIGQLRFKKLHSRDSLNYAQTITYGYNERGWLLTSSAPLFAITLYYNTGTNKQYNGNIAYQFWGVPGNLNNHYTYTYDKLNRLLSGITSLDNYQESGITYDVMGNITALNRYQNGTQIDQLSYYYNSKNQQDSVKDAYGRNSGMASGKTAYAWDGNGNMVSSTNATNTLQNKSFTYNRLNLPIVATIPTGTVTYIYDADGNKLRKTSVTSGNTKNTDYIGGIEYDGTTTDTLNFIQTAEGKALHRGSTYEYEYYLGDNLGNTRVTFGTKTGVAVVYQQDDYYPFGVEILRTSPVPNPKNEYLYNKKELQEEFSEYDYGARFYDPVIGRWTMADGFAEKFDYLTPYQSCSNNPVSNVDLEGLEGIPFQWITSIAQTVAQNPNSKASTTVGGVVGAATSVKNTIAGLNPVTFVKNLPALTPVGAAQNALNVVVDITGKINTLKNGNGFDKARVIGQTTMDAVTLVAGFAAGLDALKAPVSVASGFGDLTIPEVKSIQNVVDEAGRPMDVGGSAAKGTRRGIGTDLPIGKGPGTRSDIDYFAPPSSHPYLNPFIPWLPSFDPSKPIIPGVGDPNLGPFIRFEPNAKPVTVPASSTNN